MSNAQNGRHYEIVYSFCLYACNAYRRLSLIEQTSNFVVKISPQHKTQLYIQIHAAESENQVLHFVPRSETN